MIDSQQMEMQTGPYPVKDLVDLPSELIRQCGSVKQLIKLLFANSRVQRDYSTWAELLGTSEGNLRWMLKEDQGTRKRNFDMEDLGYIEQLSGLRAFGVYFDLQSKGLLDRQNRHAEKQRLQDRLRQIEEQESMERRWTA